MECRKHNHQSDQGVCAFCLRDKLSRLPSYVQRRSQSSSSSSASPAAVISRAAVDTHQRSGSMSFAVREALNDFYGSGMKKSRSMTLAPRDYIAGDHSTTTTAMEAVKKVGFWTKLIPFRGPHGGLFHKRQRFHC